MMQDALLLNKMKINAT